MFKHPLIIFGNMQLIFFLVISLRLAPTELLVDCVWVVDKYDCIEQQGFKCRLPVAGTAEIKVPQTFVTRPGKIGYILIGDDPSNVNLCHFVENQTEGREESKNKSQQRNIKEINYDHEGDFPVWVIGLVIGALLAVGVIVMVVVIVVYKKMCRRNTQTHTPEESDVESPSLVSSENSSRDDNSSQPTAKDPLVSSSSKQSSLPVDEDRAPLKSQSVKDDSSIQNFNH